MAGLPEQILWEPFIYQWENSDPVVGGVPNPATGEGMDNIPTLQLANRTLWLKAKLDAILDGADPALDTLVELAAALNDDANFAATVTADLANRVKHDSYITDLDALIGSQVGHYDSSAVGAPDDGDGRVLHIARNGDGEEWSQIAISYREKIWFRDKDWVGDPGPWREFWHSGNSSFSRALPGYEVLPSGLILQYGVLSVGNNTTISFPIAFPNAALVVLASDVNVDATGTNAHIVGVRELTTTTFRLTVRNHDGTSGGTNGAHYLALGY